ncbi:hypothetical protein ES703_09334 [subsurface metagenome]
MNIHRKVSCGEQEISNFEVCYSTFDILFSNFSHFTL